MQPSNIPPIYAPQQPYDQPPRRERGGCGCWAKGCAVVLFIFLLLGVLGGVTGYYLARKVRDQLTADHAEPVRVYPATDAQYAALEPRVRAFSRALDRHERAALELSADDLNVLVAKGPEFAWLRGKVFFTIESDVLGVEASLPLGEVPKLGRFLQGRFFNGKASGEVTIHRGDFRIVPYTLEANGLRVGPDAMKGYAGRISSELEESVRRDPRAKAQFDAIETLDVSADKVRLVSKGDDGPAR